MGKMPRIADVQCTRLKFEPGDRILVRTHHRMNSEQKKSICRGIQKWAGCEVEVLIVCLLDMDVEIDRKSIVLGALR